MESHPPPASKKPRRDYGPEQTSFAVFVSKENFKFNAAHFVAFEDFRERLHGHNYLVGVRLLGNRKICADGYLIDFSCIKDVTRKVCKRLNDHFLCPMLSNVLEITEEPHQITLKCQDGSIFSFPANDVAKLPIVHATSEELAIYLWVEILKLLDASYLNKRGIHTMEVIVTEAPGQEAVFQWTIPEPNSGPVSLDVKSFISQGKVIPAPCMPEGNGDHMKKNDGICCPDCQKSKQSFSEQLEKLAQAMNEKGLTSASYEKITRQDLENMLN